MYEGYLANTEDDVEGSVSIIVKTVSGMLAAMCSVISMQPVVNNFSVNSSSLRLIFSA